MPKKRLGVGLIGAGFVANFHVRAWEGVRHADINGIVSKELNISEETAATAKKLGVGEPKIFNTISDMVADPNIDAIWICAPNFTRIEVMEEIVHTLETGKGELIGIACEKPLGRNVAEAKKLLELVKKVDVLDGYLENQVFSPSVKRGKEIIWRRGAALSGRPYLARASEEHSGPHMPWFWEGSLQGGGVLNDMMCHSVETARFMLTHPDEDRTSITPKKVSAYTNCLKWQHPHYAKILKRISNGKLDYINRPSEDFARSLIEYEDKEGNTLIVETTTSWSFVGAGLRLSMELLGPEYSLSINTLESGLKVFMSREVQGDVGEDMVEKQNAETGLMPVVNNEESEYGYEAEDRYMVECFLAGKRPFENFEDGVNVAELLMTAYKSAEEGKTLDFPPPDLDKFIPKVAKGEWNPKNK